MRILYVEDDELAVTVARQTLARVAPQVELTPAGTLAAARASLAGGGAFDALLLDLGLPDGSGLELVIEVRERALPLAVVVLTSSDAGETTVAALQAGADDFVVKREGYFNSLAAVLETALQRFHAEQASHMRPLRVLYVEDNALDADLTRRHMLRHAPHIRLDVVASVPEGLERLPRSAGEPAPCDVLLLDFRISGMDAFDVLKTLRDERHLDLPVVLVTGQGDGEVAAQAFRFGVTDYLTKREGYLAELPHVLRSAHDRALLAREHAALVESEARLAYALEATAEGVWDWNITTGHVLVNPRWITSLGYAPEDVAPTREFWSGLVHPEDQAAALEAQRAHIDGDAPAYDCEMRLRLKSGRYRHYLVRGKVVERDAAGKPTRMVGTDTDITGRKLSELAMQTLSTGVARLRGEALFGELARRLARLLGLEIGFVGRLLGAAEARVVTLGLSVDGELREPVEYALAGTPCEQVIAGGACLVADGLRQRFQPHGHPLAAGVAAYAAAPLFDTAGDAVGHVGVMSRAPLENPEQVESILRLFAVRSGAEIERLRSAARFENLFESSHDGIVMVDDQGCVTEANTRALRLFGYEREEFIGLPVDELVPEAGRETHRRHRAAYRANPVASAMGVQRPPLRARRKDGGEFPVDVSLSPMPLGDGRVVVASIRDITEQEQAEAARRELEAQLRQSQTMAAMGSLVAGVAHEVRNPLFGITASIDTFEAEFGERSEARETLCALRVEAGRLNELMHALLEYGRPVRIEPSELSLNDVVAEAAQACRPLAAQHDVEVVKELDQTGLPTLQADAARLVQVVQNLIANAIQHSPRGGSVRVRTGTVTRGGRRWAQCIVEDGGQGFREQDLPRVFEPFFTRRAGGTGLGLSIAARIVHDHGGVLTAANRPEGGAATTMLLPCSPE